MEQIKVVARLINPLTPTVAIRVQILKHLVPDRVKPSSEYSGAQPWALECPYVKNYRWRLNPSWRRIAVSIMAIVDIKLLTRKQHVWLLTYRFARVPSVVGEVSTGFVVDLSEIWIVEIVVDKVVRFYIKTLHENNTYRYSFVSFILFHSIRLRQLISQLVNCVIQTFAD